MRPLPITQTPSQAPSAESTSKVSRTTQFSSFFRSPTSTFHGIASLLANSTAESTSDEVSVSLTYGNKEEFPDVMMTDDGMTTYYDDIVDEWFKWDGKERKVDRGDDESGSSETRTNGPDAKSVRELGMNKSPKPKSKPEPKVT
jgi:hypothetical protein